MLRGARCPEGARPCPPLTGAFAFPVRGAGGRAGPQIAVQDRRGAGKRGPQAVDGDHLPVRQRLQRRPARGEGEARAGPGPPRLSPHSGARGILPDGFALGESELRLVFVLRVLLVPDRR